MLQYYTNGDSWVKISDHFGELVEWYKGHAIAYANELYSVFVCDDVVDCGIETLQHARAFIDERVQS